MKFYRIHIYGCSGSGKTYLAKKLSKMFNSPHYDLDDIQYDDSDIDFTKKRDEKQRDKLLGEIVKKKKWIVEGSYRSWSRPSHSKADIIIVLNPNRFLRIFRVLKRYFSAKFGHIKRKEGSFKSFLSILTYNFSGFNKDLSGFRPTLKSYGKRVLYFKKADDAIEFVKKKIK